jgi:hypothetical protein
MLEISGMAMPAPAAAPTAPVAINSWRRFGSSGAGAARAVIFSLYGSWGWGAAIKLDTRSMPTLEVKYI